MSPSAAAQQSQSHSPTAKALMEGLQPPLRNALCSLNINLDYELARYRYARQGEVKPGVKPPQFQPRRRSLDLISVPPQPQRSQPVAPPMVAPPPPPPNPRIQAQVDAAGESSPTMAMSNDHPSEVAALRHAIVHQPNDPADAYWASSEALLEDFEIRGSSPSTEYGSYATSSSWLSNLSTPLGLGALMLLLIASAGFGFLLVNPSVARNLVSNTPLARLWSNPEAEEMAASEEATPESTDTTADFDGPPLNDLSPDLSQQEFSNLDLNTLSNLPSGSTSKEVAPSPVDDDQTTDGENAPSNRLQPNQPTLDPAANAPQVRQQVTEMPRTTTPAPRPAAPIYQAPIPVAPPEAAPQPVAPPAEPEQTSQEPTSSYYVVTDYTGDPSLDSARELVTDAYVRNFDVGARIQLGAFNTQEGAAALAEELKNQGVDAQIYEP